MYLCPDTAQLISVGWGRKETQFHGSEGKSAASRKEEVNETELLTVIVTC